MCGVGAGGGTASETPPPVCMGVFVRVRAYPGHVGTHVCGCARARVCTPLPARVHAHPGVPRGACRGAHTLVLCETEVSIGDPAPRPPEGPPGARPVPPGLPPGQGVGCFFPLLRAGRGQPEAPGTRAGAVVPRATRRWGKTAGPTSGSAGVPLPAVPEQKKSPNAHTHPCRAACTARCCFTACSGEKWGFASHSLP